MSDEKTLSSYEIMNYDIIEAIPSSRGGRDGIDMADISNKKGLIEKNYGKNAKKWNYIIKGLNITGKCENEGCEAYNWEVDCQIGIGKFDLVRDADEINCPMCKNLIQPITCTFCKCNYRLDGKKRYKDENGKLKIEKVNTDWKKVEKDYEYYDPNKSGTVNWLMLIIETKSL